MVTFSFKISCFVGAVLALGVACSEAQIDSNKVAPLWSRDKAVTKCKLHGVKLQLGTVPISYGIISGLGRSHSVASQKYFPYANSQAFGGCVIHRGIAGRQAVKFCPQCRAAEKRWLATHPSATR